MSESVSDHQVRVYEYAKVRLGRWFTIQELSTDANIPDASAKGHAVRFEEMGIFERMRASPAHLFRLSEFAASRDPKMVRRLETAIPVFAERRHDRLQRELHALGVRHRTDHHGGHQPPPFIDAAMVRASNVIAIDVQDRERVPSPSVERRPPQGPVAMIVGSPALEAGSAGAPHVDESPSYLEAESLPVCAVSRGNKVELLLSMVAREEGASLDELVVALGNLAHSIRASISVESRKRGLKIECVNRRYYLRSAA